MITKVYKHMNRTGYVLTLLILLLSGQVPAQQPASDLAEITVFTSKDMAMGAFAVNKTKVYIDGVGRHLPSDRFFTVQLPPGRHIVSSGAAMLIARRVQLDLMLKPGEHIYILESLEMGQWQGRIALRSVSCAEMERRNLGKKLKPLKEREGVLNEASFPPCDRTTEKVAALSLADR